MLFCGDFSFYWSEFFLFFFMFILKVYVKENERFYGMIFSFLFEMVFVNEVIVISGLSGVGV